MNEFSKRLFKFWAYTVSHSFLILRSPRVFPDQDGYDDALEYNIDIEFSAVAYLDVPTIMNGLIINQMEYNIPEKLIHYKLDLGYQIYEIESEGRFYYIVASSCRIGKSRWVSEDRIQNMDLKYEEIIIIS